jgi:hypothetical protein
MKKPVRIASGVLALLFVAASSCSARFDGAVEEGGGASCTFEAALGTGAAALLRSLRSFGGGDEAAPLLDGAALGQSLGALPGVAAAGAANTGPAAIRGTLELSRLEAFLSPPEGGPPLVAYREGPAAGTSSLTVTLRRETAPWVLGRLSGEAQEYLEALMAPAILGEESTRAEYLALVGSIYGRALADEIARARLAGTLRVSRPIASALGASFTGRTASFDIPLVDLLVLETPFHAEIVW